MKRAGTGYGRGGYGHGGYQHGGGYFRQPHLNTTTAEQPPADVLVNATRWNYRGAGPSPGAGMDYGTMGAGPEDVSRLPYTTDGSWLTQARWQGDINAPTRPPWQVSDDRRLREKYDRLHLQLDIRSVPRPKAGGWAWAADTAPRPHDHVPDNQWQWALTYAGRNTSPDQAANEVMGFIKERRALERARAFYAWQPGEKTRRRHKITYYTLRGYTDPLGDPNVWHANIRQLVRLFGMTERYAYDRPASFDAAHLEADRESSFAFDARSLEQLLDQLRRRACEESSTDAARRDPLCWQYWLMERSALEAIRYAYLRDQQQQGSDFAGDDRYELLGVSLKRVEPSRRRGRAVEIPTDTEEVSTPVRILRNVPLLGRVFGRPSEEDGEAIVARELSLDTGDGMVAEELVIGETEDIEMAPPGQEAPTDELPPDLPPSLASMSEAELLAEFRRQARELGLEIAEEPKRPGLLRRLWEAITDFFEDAYEWVFGADEMVDPSMQLTEGVVEEGVVEEGVGGGPYGEMSWNGAGPDEDAGEGVEPTRRAGLMGFFERTQSRAGTAIKWILVALVIAGGSTLVFLAVVAPLLAKVGIKVIETGGGIATKSLEATDSLAKGALGSTKSLAG